jgi:hypothetical protein
VIPLPTRKVRPPLWTRVGFAFATAGALIALATGVLYVAVGVAFPRTADRSGVPGGIGPSVGLMILAMVLVVAAIALPLVIRRKAQHWLDRAQRSPAESR